MRIVQLGLLFTFFLGTWGVDPAIVPLTPYVDEGALCLDGSVPAYYFRPGIGEGARNWIIHMEGGAWCASPEECYARSQTTLGSSTQWPPTLSLSNQLCCSIGGFLSDDPTQNPNFYDWTLAWIGYCDGSSFSSNLADPIPYNGTELYFRGSQILESVITDLVLNMNLTQAESVVVTGCSAGGLSTYLHLDRFRSRIPSNITVHGLADAGFFMDYPDKEGIPLYTPYMQAGFALWNASGGVNQNCINYYSEEDQWHCIMAQYTYPFIQTPIFILNSKYDAWQLIAVVNVTCLPWDGTPSACDKSDYNAFLDFGVAIQSEITSVFNATKDGMWVVGCVQHCMSLYNGPVLGWVNLTISSTTPDQAFYDWLTTGKATFLDSKPYGNNPSCPP